MHRIKEDKLVKTAYVSLAIAILSVFTTIIGYTNSSGKHRSFTIIDFLTKNGNGFDSFVSYEYMGRVFYQINISEIKVLVFIGIVAVACAIIGVSSISNQKENKSSFVLALIGLIGTAIPSVLILVLVLILNGQYEGRISCGIFPIVCPIAMVICIIATTRMHRRNVEYQKKLEEAKDLIFRGGDLQ